MLTNIFTKAIRDGWFAMVLAGLIVGGFLLFAMSAYRDIDLSLYTDLPEGIRAFMGVGDSTEAAGLAYGAMYSFLGALALAGVAIAAGSSAIAGEERNGTMGLLLANPASRSRVLLSKGASMVLVTGAGAGILAFAGWASPIVLDLETSGADSGALVLHMFANALFYGFLALMIGGWTGNGSAASGVAAAVMLVSYVAASLLPVVSDLTDLARVVPWYYYDGSDPLYNGVHWGHLIVLLGASALFVVVAVIGFNRRDLTERSAGEGVIDRLRSHPLTRAVVERLEGSARVSRVSVKAASEHQVLLLVTALLVLLFGLMMGPFYLLLEDQLAEFTEDLPEALLALIGDADIATAEGWYQTENFSLTLPIGLILVTVLMGSRALAGEEQDRTMGLLLANPISRSRIVIEKAATMTVFAFILGVVTFAGTALGSLLGGLDMSMTNIAATSLLLTLLGLVFGSAALALSAATGRVMIAAYGTAGLALAFFLLNSFLPLNKNLADLARLSPFYYYLTSDPLLNGMHWGHAGVLAALAGGLSALSVALFKRRDLKQGA